MLWVAVLRSAWRPPWPSSTAGTRFPQVGASPGGQNQLCVAKLRRLPGTGYQTVEEYVVDDKIIALLSAKDDATHSPPAGASL